MIFKYEMQNFTETQILQDLLKINTHECYEV